MGARYWLLLLLASLTSSICQAQTYRCNVNGSTYFSDRPCGSAAPQPPQPGKLGTFGPAGGGNSNSGASNYGSSSYGSSSYSGSVRKPPEYAQYLTSACAQLEEAIRTAPARGVRGDTLQGLNEEFRTRCNEDVQEAQRKFYQKRREQSQQRDDQRQQLAAAQAEQRRQDEHCANMRAVIADKRAAMASLDARQKELLQQMQENYNLRCMNRH
ncbi:hypothetical protein [Roseateles amylovorans]|uniref:DUF4124 domain-containing protein n=1 Tax=Roseateles amylovorans TaxID=2978473 RepID=A0ABY6B0C8_9BURK|nr:hypothetical protein [Roseateles amylovorans]UXH78856.1 hypothetical protein N4261_02635 [Roseateles amylovorans]